MKQESSETCEGTHDPLEYGEGERNPRTGKVWHNGEWWDELSWKQYVYDHGDGLDAHG